MTVTERTTGSPSAWLGWIEDHAWAMDPRALRALCQQAADGQFVAWMEQYAAQRESERESGVVAALVEQLLAIDDAPEATRAISAAVEAARKVGRPTRIQGAVAKVSLKGVIAPPPPFLAWLLDLEHPLVAFERNIKAAIADPDVGAVVIEIDSPGGQIDGVPEAAAMLRSLRGSKPIVAMANTMAASAAYWIAAQADEIAMTPSGAVGSIGVYATHEDMSGALKLLGVDVTLISAGKYKTEGHPSKPLDDDAREHIQQNVDYFYDQFVSDVAKGRGVSKSDVKSGYGEGRVLNAKLALDAGLVDYVETPGDTVGRLSSRQGAARRTSAEAETPEPTSPEAEATEPEPTSDVAANAVARESVLAALADEVDPVLAARAFDKIGALSNN